MLLVQMLYPEALRSEANKKLHKRLMSEEPVVESLRKKFVGALNAVTSNGRAQRRGRRSSGSRNGGSSPEKNGRAASAGGKLTRRGADNLWRSYVETHAKS